MLSRTIRFLKAIAFQERSPEKLAFASALSMYVAWSPFLGLHTLMLVFCGWIFKLNIPFLIAVSYGINNPWTMVPIYMGGYVFGYWLLHSCLTLPITALNPSWMGWINQKATALLGIQDISFWAFMVGGNILGVLLGLVTYPVALRVFRRIMRKG